MIDERAASLRRRLWGLTALLALVLASIPLVVRAVVRARVAPLPVLWPMPAWSLVDQDGRAFGARQLAGHVYVTDFIFTSCTASCPMLTARMASLQDRLGDRGGIRFVSISVDPSHDSPERLRAFASRFHADTRTWSFVTGPEDDVVRAVDQGFRVGVEWQRGAAYDPITLAHSNKFALVDAQGRLRGAYDSDTEGLARLAHDALALANESR